MKKIHDNLESEQASRLNSGQAMIIATLFFLAVSLTMIFGMTGPILRQQAAVSNLSTSRQSYFLAEAGVEDVVYRLKSGYPVNGTEVLNLSGGSVTTVTTNDGLNGKDVMATGLASQNVRKVKAEVFESAGVAFNYGLQAGNGGVDLEGGSTINGNIYANSSIIGISSTITGSAVAADSAALALDQSNDSPTTPASSINFRDVSVAQDFAQSLQLSSTELLNKVQFYIKKVGNPSNATVRIVVDNAGIPSNTEIATGGVSLNSASVTASYGWVEVVFTTRPSLQTGVTYWVVIDNSTQNANNYYVIGANSAYASGAAKTGVYSGTWNVTNLDSYFKVYTGGVTSTIGEASYSTGLMVGQNGVGNVWANIVRGTSVAGNLYCNTGFNNNKPCNTTNGLPPQVPLPLTDENISAWKAEAEAGGTIVGNHTVDWQNGTFGPKKITGNLTVNGGGTLTMTGTLWVQGTVTVNGGGKVVLPANFQEKSGVILSDSRMNISGGGSAGSGQSGSYLFLVTTSACPNALNCSGSPAIAVTGGAGAIAVNAQNGTVSLSGGASFKAAVAKTLNVSGGAIVTYDAGLASPTFVSGPSGGYSIESWKEVE